MLNVVMPNVVTLDVVAPFALGPNLRSAIDLFIHQQTRTPQLLHLLDANDTTSPFPDWEWLNVLWSNTVSPTDSWSVMRE
jgi:hypothetical protein